LRQCCVATNWPTTGRIEELVARDRAVDAAKNRTGATSEDTALA